MLNRRTLMSTLLLSGFAASSALAQAYPNRPITLLVPAAPGGAADTIARVFAQHLSRELGQSVVIEDRPGAGGNIATGAAAKAPRDGYTLLLSVGSAHTINPSLYERVPFDPLKDFQPISLVATAPYVLAVNPGVPAKNVAELVAHAKSMPGKLNYASAGNGSLNHLLGEMFNRAAGVQLTHVPYKTAAALTQDAVGGQVQVIFSSLPSVMPFAKSGQLRVLGVATPARTALAPDLPTIGETLSGYQATSWYGLVAPAGIPKEALDRLQAASTKALANPEVVERLAAQGAEVTPSTAEQFTSLIREDLARWAKIVKAAGARMD